MAGPAWRAARVMDVPGFLVDRRSRTVYVGGASPPRHLQRSRTPRSREAAQSIPSEAQGGFPHAMPPQCSARDRRGPVQPHLPSRLHLDLSRVGLRQAARRVPGQRHGRRLLVPAAAAGSERARCDLRSGAPAHAGLRRPDHVAHERRVGVRARRDAGVVAAGGHRDQAGRPLGPLDDLRPGARPPGRLRRRVRLRHVLQRRVGPAAGRAAACVAAARAGRRASRRTRLPVGGLRLAAQPPHRPRRRAGARRERAARRPALRRLGADARRHAHLDRAASHGCLARLDRRADGDRGPCSRPHGGLRRLQRRHAGRRLADDAWREPGLDPARAFRRAATRARRRRRGLRRGERPHGDLDRHQRPLDRRQPQRHVGARPGRARMDRAGPARHPARRAGGRERDLRRATPAHDPLRRAGHHGHRAAGPGDGARARRHGALERARDAPAGAAAAARGDLRPAAQPARDLRRHGRQPLPGRHVGALARGLSRVDRPGAHRQPAGRTLRAQPAL